MILGKPMGSFKKNDYANILKKKKFKKRLFDSLYLGQIICEKAYRRFKTSVFNILT